MIRPRLPKLASGTRLTTNLVNDIINRIEYAADLLRQYKLTAGNEMYVEPHYDGTRVSYLQVVAGGARPTQPIFYNDGSNPDSPATIDDLFKLYGDTDSSGTPFINLDSHDANNAIYLNTSGYTSANGVLFKNASSFAVQFTQFGQGAVFSAQSGKYELFVSSQIPPTASEIVGIAFSLDQAVAIRRWSRGF